MSQRLRIYFTGVGGQGTLTATTLLARTALDQDLEVVSGEVHGMSQRGGVVESSLLIGGWMSPTIYHGEADILLGFEPLETLRALPYLAPGGFVLSSSEFVPPLSVSMGRERLPELSAIEDAVRKVAGKYWFLPMQTLGRKAGAVQSGNTALLGALCAAGVMPFGPEALREAIRKHLPDTAEVNLRALELGVGAIR